MAVYVNLETTHVPGDVYHTDPNCQTILENGKPIEERWLLPSWKPCEHCIGAQFQHTGRKWLEMAEAMQAAELLSDSLRLDRAQELVGATGSRNDIYRYACGRCGSQSVRRQQNGTWQCNSNKHHSTPAVYDLKMGWWVHMGPEQETTDRYSSERPMKAWPGGGLE